MTRTWTDEQNPIFRWFADGAAANLVVRARAGTGKTTTIIEGIRHAPEGRILLCAFNKRIATELQERLSNPAAEAATLHSVGYGCVRRYWEGVRIANGREREQALVQEVCGGKHPDAMLKLVGKLCTKGREMAPFAHEPGDLAALAEAFECVPDEDWADDGYDVAWVEKYALAAMALAADKKPARGIDFADMLYLPVRNRWLHGRYPLVVVDEAQDMNATQLRIARGVAKGRICVVGDDKQAIYAFRGADSGSIDRLKHELHATELTLTTTFRCGKRIVAAAQQYVPDFQAAPINPDGEVRTLLQSQLAAEVEIGDAVLSRKNAPLASTALRILRTGKRCRIEGKDIGAGLTALVNRLAKGKAKDSMPEFLGKLAVWERRETERAERELGERAEARIETIVDKAATLRALAEGLSGVPELIARIGNLFADDKRPAVVCSSVHKAKGLEWERVYLLQDTFSPALPCECGHWPGAHGEREGCKRCGCSRFIEDAARRQEEDNVAYVAITRAKSTLVWVIGATEGR